MYKETYNQKVDYKIISVSFLFILLFNILIDELSLHQVLSIRNGYSCKVFLIALKKQLNIMHKVKKTNQLNIYFNGYRIRETKEFQFSLNELVMFANIIIVIINRI